MTSSKDEELRAVVKFCVGLGRSTNETIDMIEESATTYSCSKSCVCKWHERLSKGRTTVTDDPHQGRLATVKTSILDVVRDVGNAHRRVTVRVIADYMSVSCYTVHRILTQELGMSTVSARWVPRHLKDSNSDELPVRLIFYVGSNARANDSYIALLRATKLGSIILTRKQSRTSVCGNHRHHRHQRMHGFSAA